MLSNRTKGAFVFAFALQDPLLAQQSQTRWPMLAGSGLQPLSLPRVRYGQRGSRQRGAAGLGDSEFAMEELF